MWESKLGASFSIYFFLKVFLGVVVSIPKKSLNFNLREKKKMKGCNSNL